MPVWAGLPGRGRKRGAASLSGVGSQRGDDYRRRRCREDESRNAQQHAAVVGSMRCEARGNEVSLRRVGRVHDPNARRIDVCFIGPPSVRCVHDSRCSARPDSRQAPPQPVQKCRSATRAAFQSEPPASLVPYSISPSRAKNTGSPARRRRTIALISSAPNALP